MPSSTTSSKPRVLVVDDNDAMLARLDAVLTPACVIVGTARDGEAALAAAHALQPEVIVLDVSMPGMSGLEVADRLKRAGCTAAIVFFTVHREEAIVAEARASGALGYVVKPRLRADLLRAIDDAVAGRAFVSPLQ